MMTGKSPFPEGAPLPDMNKLSAELMKTWEKAMSDWWEEVLDSPAFLTALGQNMASQTRVRSAYEEQVDKTMEQLHLPTRKDMIRLARISSLLEERLLSMEDRLQSMEDRIAQAETESLRARLDQAELLLSMKQRLDSIEARLPAPRKRKPSSPRKPRAD